MRALTRQGMMDNIGRQKQVSHSRARGDKNVLTKRTITYSEREETNFVQLVVVTAFE